jgi:hypothetical protein
MNGEEGLELGPYRDRMARAGTNGHQPSIVRKFHDALYRVPESCTYFIITVN